MSSVWRQHGSQRDTRRLSGTTLQQSRLSIRVYDLREPPRAQRASAPEPQGPSPARRLSTGRAGRQVEGGFRRVTPLTEAREAAMQKSGATRVLYHPTLDNGRPTMPWFGRAAMPGRGTACRTPSARSRDKDKDGTAAVFKFCAVRRGSGDCRQKGQKRSLGLIFCLPVGKIVLYPLDNPIIECYDARVRGDLPVNSRRIGWLKVMRRRDSKAQRSKEGGIPSAELPCCAGRALR
jgi:hypothetical protein